MWLVKVKYPDGNIETIQTFEKKQKKFAVNYAKNMNQLRDGNLYYLEELA